MLTAFALALAQLPDRRIMAILLKAALVTLVVTGLIGWGLWWGSIKGLGLIALGTTGLSSIMAAILAVVGAWLLVRVVALAVLQLFADDVIAAVEARHYPEAAARARPLGLHREALLGLRSALRSLLWNLAALPFALILLITGVGPLIVFGVVNAVLLGRELTETVRMRHRDPPLPDVPFVTRTFLGGVIVALLTVPFVNLLASVIGAAMATHLVHRQSRAR